MNNELNYLKNSILAQLKEAPELETNKYYYSWSFLLVYTTLDKYFSDMLNSYIPNYLTPDKYNKVHRGLKIEQLNKLYNSIISQAPKRKHYMPVYFKSKNIKKEFIINKTLYDDFINKRHLICHSLEGVKMISDKGDLFSFLNKSIWVMSEFEKFLNDVKTVPVV